MEGKGWWGRLAVDLVWQFVTLGVVLVGAAMVLRWYLPELRAVGFTERQTMAAVNLAGSVAGAAWVAIVLVEMVRAVWRDWRESAAAIRAEHQHGRRYRGSENSPS